MIAVHRNLAVWPPWPCCLARCISGGAIWESGRCPRYHPDWHQQQHTSAASSISLAGAAATVAARGSIDRYIPMTTLALF